MSQRHANPVTIGGDRARLGTFRYTLKRLSRHWQLYLVLLIPVALLIIFSYGPMYGVQIAFKDFKVRQGIWGSKWVGMKHFENFWGTYSFKRLITNTLTLSVYSLVAGFPDTDTAGADAQRVRQPEVQKGRADDNVRRRTSYRRLSCAR